MDEGRLAARVGGAMMLAGAALGAVSVILPPRATGSDAIVLSFRHALAQLALVAVAYSLLLTDTPGGEAATRWLISITTLLVAES